MRKHDGSLLNRTVQLHRFCCMPSDFRRQVIKVLSPSKVHTTTFDIKCLIFLTLELFKSHSKVKMHTHSNTLTLLAYLYIPMVATISSGVSASFFCHRLMAIRSTHIWSGVRIALDAFQYKTNAQQLNKAWNNQRYTKTNGLRSSLFSSSVSH